MVSPALGSSPHPSCRDRPPTIPQVPTWGGTSLVLLLSLLHRRPWLALSSLCTLLAEAGRVLTLWEPGLSGLDVPTLPCAARLWLQLQ